MQLFLFKNHTFDPKMQNNHNYPFWYHCARLSKITRKLQKLQLIISIYPNEKSVICQKLWLLRNLGDAPPPQLNPSTVATSKVKWHNWYYYFDQQSSLKSFIINNINFPSTSQNFGKKCEYDTSDEVMQHFLRSIVSTKLCRCTKLHPQVVRWPRKRYSKVIKILPVGLPVVYNILTQRLYL